MGGADAAVDAGDLDGGLRPAFDSVGAVCAREKGAGESRDSIRRFCRFCIEAPAEADWTIEKVWKQCNPALGDFRSLEEMRIRVRAGEGDPGAREYLSAACI